ncbi:MAG: class I SAM-dependent methyltransferase [Alphaproteobacteria bacterium]|nr:class I SAM-dependent methyltransferase [Alphaproteobacteria bacterium]
MSKQTEYKLVLEVIERLSSSLLIGYQESSNVTQTVADIALLSRTKSSIARKREVISRLNSSLIDDVIKNELLSLLEKRLENKWFKRFVPRTNQKAKTGRFFRKFIRNLAIGDSPWTPSTMLDIGCGEGTLAKHILESFQRNSLALEGRTYAAIDIVDKNVSKVSQDLGTFPINLDVRQGNAFEYDLANFGKQDLIIASHVFYWANDIESIMGNVCNLLSDNGLAIIIHDSPESDQNQFRINFRATVNPHTTSTVERILNSKGMTHFNYIIESELIFPNNTIELKENLLKTVNGEIDINDHADLKYLKYLVEFVVQRPLEELAEEGIAQEYLGQLCSLLQEQNNRLILRSSVQVVASNKCGIDLSERLGNSEFRNSVNVLAKRIEHPQPSVPSGGFITKISSDTRGVNGPSSIDK